MGKQKRSENTYQKINTIFMRDAKNVIMPFEPFVEPEFEYLRSLKWRGEEKIDGTNMRIEVKKGLVAADDGTVHGVSFEVRFAGKTDNAQIPPKLLAHMKEKYTDDKVLASLGLKEFIPIEEWEAEHNWLSYEQIPNLYTIYGEGYGFYTEEEAYKWYDEGNTELTSTINNSWGSWCYWSGGVAVSNYYTSYVEASNTTQLGIDYNKDGIARVNWTLYPDGRYFADEDGFGMEDNDEVNIDAYIDTECRVLVKFQDMEDLEKAKELYQIALKKVIK